MNYLEKILLGLFVYLLPIILTASITVHFDKDRYEVTPGESVTVQVNLDADDSVEGDQPVANGLFSYGVKLTFDGSIFQVGGETSITVPADLNFTGFDEGATKSVDDGFAAVKGTVDVELDPLQPYFGTVLASFELMVAETAPPTTLVDLDLEIYRTLGESEDVFLDIAGNVLDDQITFRSSSALVLTPFDLPLHPGWNLVSTPLTTEQSVATLFGVHLIGKVWKWNGQIYEIVTEIEPTCGYWLYSKDQTEVKIGGTQVSLEKIQLRPNWNLIGPFSNPPYDEVEFTDILDSTTLFHEPIWEWDGKRFIVARKFKPGKGYSVYREN